MYKKKFFFFILIYSLFTVHCSLFTVSAFAQDDILSLIEKKQKEIKVKEEALSKEEERLNVLKKDIDMKIEKYTKLLKDIENVLKKIEHVKEEKLEHVVKAYEAMPPEDAAAKLTALDEPTALDIIRRMKSKKAGTIMAFMDAKKAASITHGMTRGEKKFPAE